MQAVGLDGSHASPKRRRHGFEASAGIALDLAQRWLGRAQLFTTAIYADAVNAEQEDLALRWSGTARDQMTS